METTTLSTEPLIFLEYDEAVDLLNQAVAEKGPDYVYDEPDSGLCVYFAKGGPSCIVGHLLAYQRIEEAQVGALNDENVRFLVRHNVIGMDEKTQRLLEIAQEQQDGLVPWGDAVAMAIWCAETGKAPFQYLGDWWARQAS